MRWWSGRRRRAIAQALSSPSERRRRTCSPRGGFAAGRSCDAGSRFRSCFRRPWRGSACSAAFGRLGLLGGRSRCARDLRRVHPGSRSCWRSSIRREPVLPPRAIAAFEAVDKDLIAAVRDPRCGPWPYFRRVAHAACRWWALRPAAAPALRTRSRGVRSDDDLRRQPPGGHPDAAARGLRRVRCRLRRRAGDQCALRASSSAAMLGRRQGSSGVDALRFDLGGPDFAPSTSG